MKRRRFMECLAGAAILLPMAGSAEQVRIPVVGFLSSASAELFPELFPAFRRGLGMGGFVDGRNVSIEYRWADGVYAHLPALALDLVQRDVAVIATTGGTVSAQAAKAATQRIPIVSLMGGDPATSGLVTSLNRPEGNITGVSQLANDAAPKRLELLSQLVPAVMTVGLLVNPTHPNAKIQTREMEIAARALNRGLVIIPASSEPELSAAFSKLDDLKVGALIVSADPFFAMSLDRIVALAADYAVPAIYPWRQDVAAGGLISYGTDLADAVEQVGIYTARILNGATLAELPVVQQSTKLALWINLRTAKKLGLRVPPSLQAIADEVIE
jgi:putative tryptophan/tyrosine transport system substrate-binding protein